jgi:hypothetical protein
MIVTRATLLIPLRWSADDCESCHAAGMLPATLVSSRWSWFSQFPVPSFKQVLLNICFLVPFPLFPSLLTFGNVRKSIPTFGNVRKRIPTSVISWFFGCFCGRVRSPSGGRSSLFVCAYVGSYPFVASSVVFLPYLVRRSNDKFDDSLFLCLLYFLSLFGVSFTEACCSMLLLI